MAPTRTLIVNADDFGRAPGINRGIVRAHEQGIVTSTSLMVRWPAAEAAAALAREQPRLAVGLHVDLGEWAGGRDGVWTATYEVVDFDDEQAVEREVRAQLERFRQLLGRDPTHLDSHQHVHRDGIAATVLQRLAADLRVPLRGTGDIEYRGDFFGMTGEGDPYPEGITVENLVRVLGTLRPGLSELACHPGDDAQDDPVYGSERVRELRALCSAEVRATLDRHGVVLASFSDIGRNGGPDTPRSPG